MGDVKSKKVLDAGCGEGYFSRLMAKKGAIVTSIDYSSRMVQIARERTKSNLNIEIREGNCEDLYFLNKESYNLVVS